MSLRDLWDDHDSGIESESEVKKAQREDQADKRRRQTENARKALLIKKRQKKEDAWDLAFSEKMVDSRQELLQEHYFTRRLFSPGQYNDTNYKKMKAERARCAFSLIRALLQVLRDLCQTPPQHCICCVTADDTNTRMRPPSGRSQIFTVCDTVQNVHLRSSACDGCPWTTLHIPTPLIALPGSKASDIHAGMTAWSVFCGRGLGTTLQSFGLAEEDLGAVFKAKFRTTIFIGDALKANDAAWTVERHIMKRQERPTDSDNHHTALRIKCLTHQINLIRKPVVLSSAGMWSCFVRLAHLFQAHSFRRAFATSLLAVLQSPGTFHRISAWL